MSAHKHAENIRLYAEDAAETDEPWKRWQWRDWQEVWKNCRNHPSWMMSSKYRRKPKTSRQRFDEWAREREFDDHMSYVAWCAWQEAERQAKELSND